MVDLSRFAADMHSPAADLDKLAQEAKRRETKREEQSKFGDLRTFKFPKGKTEFILCPPYSKKGHVIYSTFTHWRLGEGGKGKAFCPKHTHPDKDWGCPVCYVIDLLLRNGVDPDRLQGFNSPAPTESAYSQVLLIESDGEDLDELEYLPTVVRFSPSMKDKLIGIYARYTTRLFDPNGAIILEMTVGEKRGKGNKVFPSYELTTLPDKMPMAEDADTMGNIMEAMYDLEQLGFYTGEWSEYDFRQSAQLANHLLEEMGFRAIESWEGSMDEGWEEDPDEIEEKGLPSIPESLAGTGMKKGDKKKGGAKPKNRRPSRRKTAAAESSDDDKEDD